MTALAPPPALASALAAARVPAAAVVAAALALAALATARAIYTWARCFYYLGKIPHPKGRMLLGQTLDMLAPNHHLHLRAWAKAHGGLFSMRVAHRRMLVVADARLVHALYGAGEALDKCLEPPLGNKMISQKPGHNTLFTDSTNGAHWRLVRKGTAPAFVMKNIKAGFPGIVALADRLAAALTAAGPTADVDVNNMYMRFAMDITGVVGFAKDFGTTASLADASTDSLFDVLRDGMLELYRTATNPARPLMVWSADQRRGTRAWGVYKAHMRALVAEVKARGPPAADDQSIAAHLLRLTDPATGAPLDDAQLAGEFGVYFAAGIESAGNALTWTTYLLSQHPRVERKLCEELAAAGLLATPENPAPRALTYADLNELPYLAMVCKEAMRCKPVASSGTTRRVKRDLVVGGHLVPAGSVVLAPFDAVHHLPQNWPDNPDEFRPERWADAGAEFLAGDDARGAGADGDAHLHATADVADVGAGRVRRFIPFSVGPRQCVGQSLARLMHDGGIAALYSRFTFTLAPRAGGPEGVAAGEINRLTLQPVAGLWMRAVPRV